MIEEIPAAGMKIVDVDRPSAPGNADADVVLDVALPAHRNEAETLRDGEIERRPGQAVQGRRLVVVSKITVQRPIQARDANASAHTRIGRIFVNEARVM